jgi:hypothetical protein
MGVLPLPSGPWHIAHFALNVSAPAAGAAGKELRLRPAKVRLRIPTKKIVHSELKTIRSSPKGAVESIVERVIVMGQEKGSGCVQHHFVSLFSAGVADAEFA